MIIDMHTHTFPDKIAAKAVGKLAGLSQTVPFSDGTVSGLRRNAQKAGIALSVVLPVATSPEQVVHINNFAIAQNLEEKKILSFGTMHPDFDGYREELARIAEAGLKGIKIHPYYHEKAMEHLSYMRILDRTAELGLIVVTHAGYDVGFPGRHDCTVPMLRRVMLTVPGVTLVAAHMGGWKEWDQVPDLLADTGIYLDTSFSTGYIHPLEESSRWSPEDRQMLDAEAFAAIVQAFPAGHVLFGTDSPWTDPSESIAFIRDAPLSTETKEDILGKAAERLLHL